MGWHDSEAALAANKLLPKCHLCWQDHLDSGPRRKWRPFPTVCLEALQRPQLTCWDVTRLRAHTGIPVPICLGRCNNAASAINREYIIRSMFRACIWLKYGPAMSRHEQIRRIGATCRHKDCKRRIGKYPAYGSLYHADTRFEPALKMTLNQEFWIGPHSGAMYCDCHPGKPKYYSTAKPNRGPCKCCAVFHRLERQLSNRRVSSLGIQ